MKKIWILAAFVAAFSMMAVPGFSEGKFSAETRECLECHSSMPGIVIQWTKSSHWNAGVGCYECHMADKDDPDAMDHNEYTIATIVSPRDCGRCHARETVEQEASHHADAGNILNSADALLGQTLGGEPAVAVGCRQCHGSVVVANSDGSLDPATWPNTGIGRVNPDGSKGSSDAWAFSRAIRSPPLERSPDHGPKTSIPAVRLQLYPVSNAARRLVSDGSNGTITILAPEAMVSPVGKS